MSIQAVNAVFAAGGIPGSDRLVLLAYANYADAYGYCWPGIERVADDCGVSASTVKRARARLTKNKIIKSVRRIDARGEPITNLTRLNLPLLEAMKRAPRIYNDNLVNRISFEPDPPYAGSVTSELAADLLMGQVEPDLGVNLTPPTGQIDPLTISDPSLQPSDAPGDGRRPTAGGYARAKNTGAAGAKNKKATSAANTDAARQRPATKRVRTTPRTKPAGFEEVAAALPPEVQPSPGRPLAPTLVRAICDVLTGVPDSRQPGAYRIPPRTPAHLVARINRRWYQARGPERAAYGYRGEDPIRRPVGYVAELLLAQECPDPACEDGRLLDTGKACPACRERRAAERQDEQEARAARRAAEQRLAAESARHRNQRDQDAAAAVQEQLVRRALAAAGAHGAYLEHHVAQLMAAWRHDH
ncbi:helix-turn-helix domain-containing protein [Streptomyces sp. NPDC050504]|uniref:helix-turn-helix domain-containing protein n=1 Tax=Streptomyces sp. NPDC050504 TaxID=3365618 RepID=UPI0037A6BF98